jgi:hypothetical protein
MAMDPTTWAHNSAVRVPSSHFEETGFGRSRRPVDQAAEKGSDFEKFDVASRTYEVVRRSVS